MSRELTQEFVGLGDLPGHVELFLLRVLKANTLNLYRDTLAGFRAELNSRMFDWKVATETERDIFLAEYIVEAHDMGQRPQSLAVLLAALHKIMPHQRFRIALATVQAWKAQLPIRQAPSCPADLAHALSVLAWSADQREFAIVVALSFCGLLRISEPLRLRVKDVVVLPTGLCLLLAETKRGLEQRVDIEDIWVRTMVLLYLADPPDNAGAKGLDKWLPLSYAKFMYWLRKFLDVLKIVSVPLTSHSFRRGGASHLLLQGWRVEDVCIRGRWSAIASATSYLRQGETLITRFQSENAAVWGTVCRIGNLRHSWLLVDDNMKKVATM